ncbi:MAG TPA: TOBE domain-containing protein [Kiritimatiellia bacterium]|nr:TOBE domain-containing protein [Kiritimatiellia bacterium]
MEREKENGKEETIVLDARVDAVLHTRAFRAQLDNGHEIVAYRPPGGAMDSDLRPGDRVRVRLSPYDMSVGKIVDTETEILGHES